MASLVVLGLTLGAALAILSQAAWLGIGPVPTMPRVRATLLQLVPRTLTGEIHELGCGWGGLAVALSRHCPNARVIAWEASLVPFVVAWLRARGRANLSVRCRRYAQADFTQASAVVTFLFRRAMAEVAERLRTELPAQALVVSHTFAMPNWVPESTLYADDIYRTPVFRYSRASRSDERALT